MALFAAQTIVTTNEFSIIRTSEKVVDFFLNYSFQILGALIILGAGFTAAWWLGASLLKGLQSREMEPPLRNLIVRIVRLLVVGFTMVIALEKLGVPIGPMIAGIGVAGVGIGLAMQGVLGNLVAGLTIIFTKPFRVGEYIDILGVNGQVTNIELFSTTLLKGDLSHIVVPNRKIVGEILHNYGNVRQLDLSIGISYGTDVGKALAAARSVVNASSLILKDPLPSVGISTLADSSIVLAVKPWAVLENYGAAQAELNKALIERFRAEQIEIPVPQREIRLLQSPTPNPLPARTG